METTILENSDGNLKNVSCVLPDTLIQVPVAITQASINKAMRVVGAAMEIDKPGDELAVAVLEIALAQGEEGEILEEEATATDRVDTGESSTEQDKHPSKWVTATNHELILEAMGTAPSMICQLCKAKCTSRRKRLRLHARFHYVHSFCKCGYNSKWRETIRAHQKDARNLCDSTGPVYEIDSASFVSWW